MSGLQAQLDGINNQIESVKATINRLEAQQRVARNNLRIWEQSPPVAPFVVLNQRRALDAVEKNLRRERLKLQQLQADRERVKQQITAQRDRLQRERDRIRQGNVTRGGLVPALIYPVDRNGEMIESYFATVSNELRPLPFMFNPADYTVKKKNKYKKNGLNADRTYNLEFDSDVKPRTLTLGTLWFDTTDTGDDVRQYTDVLMNYTEVQTATGTDFSGYTGAWVAPPYVAFEWGNFRFLAVVSSVSVEFVLFDRNGTPLRAKAKVTFKEFKHRKLYARQNPSSGGGPDNSTWSVSTGDRLDTIAAEVYGDAGKWRVIAAHNGIVNPLSIRPGQSLAIPSPWEEEQ